MARPTSIAWFVAAALAVAACNKPRHDDERKLRKADANAAPRGIPPDKLVELTAKVDYADRALDVLILQEAFDLNYMPTGRATQEKLKTAAPVLAARLKYAPYDVRLAFAHARPWGDLNGAGGEDPNKGELDAREGATVLNRGTPDLAAVIAKKFLPPEGQLSYPGYTRRFAPLTALKRIVAAQAAKAEGDRAIVRKGAFLSVLYVGEAMEQQESVLPDEMASYLDATVGVGQWSFSALSLTPVEDKAGCQNNNGFFLDGDAVASARLVVKMQEKSKGLFLSRCAPSFLGFFDNFLLEAGGMRYFSVDIPEKAMWDNLEVLVGGRPFYGWRYDVGSKSLRLPRLLAKGSAVRIRYEKDDGSRPNVANDPGLGGEKPLPPEEQQFLADANPILARNCGGGGCHGDGSAQQTYVGRYANVKAGKDAIVGRLEKPDGDAQKMPQGRNMAPQEKDALLKYLKELK